ncbi:DNA-binding protein [Azospirillum ramasamyi]|uniref:DNA-binding protein n=1 Tax=Azospirillum ramasamyi TaxID=682998 RepID=UPI001B3B6700|nr:DNA-binding protein [Azospirillum ramasamyi]
MSSANHIEAHLTESQLARRWAVTEKKLQADRLKGVGCPFVKIGRAVRYRLEDILAYEAARLRTSTSEG